MCSTLIRLQEFYESDYDNIRNKFFTLEEYMDTYAEDVGQFDYYEDVDGCNVPCQTIKKFFEVFKDDLREKERFLYDLIKSVIPNFESHKEEKFYLIASYKDEPSNAYIHEYSHALFYLNENFRKEMIEEVYKVREDFKSDFDLVLMQMGYTDDVLIDEFQAFISTSSPSEILDNYLNNNGLKTGWKVGEIKKIQKPFKNILETFQTTPLKH